MKKIVIFFLLSFVFLASSSALDGKDHPIVGKWEYVKTILPDGSEVINLIAIEHYYSDGTFLYVNAWLKPQPINEFSNSPEEIKNILQTAIGAIATYKIEKGKEKDTLTYTVATSTKVEDMGKSVSVEIKVTEDTLIFYYEGNQVFLKRVADK